MFKKIRIVTIFITILLSIMIIIGIMFVLDGVGIIDLGGSNSNSSVNGVVTDADVREVMAMSDTEVWKGLTGGLLTDRPADKNPATQIKLKLMLENKL